MYLTRSTIRLKEECYCSLLDCRRKKGQPKGKGEKTLGILYKCDKKDR